MCIEYKGNDIQAIFDQEFIDPDKVKQTLQQAGYSDCGKDWPARLLLFEVDPVFGTMG